MNIINLLCVEFVNVELSDVDETYNLQISSEVVKRDQPNCMITF